MHFPVAIIESSFRTYGLLNVYSDTEESVDKTLALILDWCSSVRSPDPRSLQDLVDRLHAEYLSHANVELRNCREQIGWHRAFCLLSLVLFSGDQCWIVHIGDSTIATIEQGDVFRIAPIHNLGAEFAERTLERAGLADLSNMTTEMAEAMIGVLPGSLDQLKGKLPSELAAEMGSFNTRVIGDRGWVAKPHYDGPTMEPRPPRSYISNLPLTRDLNLLILEPVSISSTFANISDREIRLAMEKKWPSSGTSEVGINETCRMTSRDFGIRIHLDEGHSVDASLISLAEP